MRQVGLTHQRVFAKDEKGFDRPAARAIHHFSRRQPGLRVQPAPPRPLEFGANHGFVHTLVTRIDVEQPPGVGTTLNVVLSAQRVEPRAFSAQVAAHQRQVGQGQRIIGAVRALADAHPPIDRCTGGISVQPRRPPDVLGWHPGDVRGVFGGPAFQAFDVIGKPFGARLDELAVVQFLLDDDMRHSLEQHDIGARTLTQPDRRKIGQLDVPWIGHDQLCTVLAHRLFEKGRNHGMGFAGVRSGDHETLQAGHLGDGI